MKLLKGNIGIKFCDFVLGNHFFSFFFKILFICSSERERKHKQGEWQAELVIGSPLSRELDAGQDLGIMT